MGKWQTLGILTGATVILASGSAITQTGPAQSLKSFMNNEPPKTEIVATESTDRAAPPVAAPKSRPQKSQPTACAIEPDPRTPKLPDLAYAGTFKALEAPDAVVRCSANRLNFSFFAQMPNLNNVTVDPNAVLNPNDPTKGAIELNFGSMHNIAGEHPVDLKGPGVFQIQAAIKSDQETNFAFLCGLRGKGLAPDGQVLKMQNLITAQKYPGKAVCQFTLQEGQTVSAVQVGFRAVPSEKARGPVSLYFFNFDVVDTKLSLNDPRLQPSGIDSDRPPQNQRSLSDVPPPSQGKPMPVLNF